MSKEIIIINEDNHGLIGVALNYYHAVKWLIDKHWIDDDTEVYNYDTEEWRPVKDVLGENWASLMLDEWDLDRFNDFGAIASGYTMKNLLGQRANNAPPVPAPGQRFT